MDEKEIEELEKTIRLTAEDKRILRAPGWQLWLEDIWDFIRTTILGAAIVGVLLVLCWLVSWLIPPPHWLRR